MNETAPQVSPGGLARCFLRLGAAGFGGSIALVGYMHRDLVEPRGWVREEEYREGLARAQLSPGPLAANSAFTPATSAAGSSVRRSPASRSCCPASGWYWLWDGPTCTGFIGYLVAGLAGACIAAAATFLPSFLFTVIPAPCFHRYGKRPWLAAIITGITAAATGAIAGAMIVLARQSLVDLTTVLIARRPLD